MDQLSHTKIHRRRFLQMAGLMAGDAIIGPKLSQLEQLTSGQINTVSYAGNVILKNGADPSALVVNGNIYYAGIYNYTQLHINEAASIPKLAEVNSGSRQSFIWQGSNKDIGEGTQIWGPQLHNQRLGGFVVYAATFDGHPKDNQHIFALGADKINGPYEYLGKVNTGPDWAIDGSRFNYQGDDFFVWSGKRGDGRISNMQSIHIAPLINSTTIDRQQTSIISSPNYDWEFVSPSQGINEAPRANVSSNSGRVLSIIFSANGSWTPEYCLGQTVFTGDDPLNPHHWQKQPKPVFAAQGLIIGPGAHCLIEQDNTNWLLYANKVSFTPGWDRQVRAQTFSYSQDGLPEFGQPRYSFQPNGAITT